MRRSTPPVSPPSAPATMSGTARDLWPASSLRYANAALIAPGTIATVLDTLATIGG